MRPDSPCISGSASRRERKGRTAFGGGKDIKKGSPRKVGLPAHFGVTMSAAHSVRETSGGFWNAGALPTNLRVDDTGRTAVQKRWFSDPSHVVMSSWYFSHDISL